MVKKFIFKKDYSFMFVNKENFVPSGAERAIKIFSGIEYVYDGCVPLFAVDSDRGNEYGEVVYREE